MMPSDDGVQGKEEKRWGSARYGFSCFAPRNRLTIVFDQTRKLANCSYGLGTKTVNSMYNRQGVFVGVRGEEGSI